MNLGNLNQFMKMAQKVQQDMARVQEELAQKTVEASAGGGAVRATASGRKEIIALEIDPEVIVPEEAEILQEMILAAVNQALKQAEEMASDAMAKVTGGLKLPGLF
jgi:hypothetical protein